jgi:hypothetical protein
LIEFDIKDFVCISIQNKTQSLLKKFKTFHFILCIHQYKEAMIQFFFSEQCQFCCDLEDFIQANGIKNVEYFNVAEIEVPSWLSGVPAVVIDRSVFMGDAAFEKIREEARRVPSSLGPPKIPQRVTPIIQQKAPKKLGSGGKGPKGSSIAGAYHQPEIIDEAELDRKYSKEAMDMKIKSLQAAHKR